MAGIGPAGRSGESSCPPWVDPRRRHGPSTGAAVLTASSGLSRAPEVGIAPCPAAISRERHGPAEASRLRAPTGADGGHPRLSTPVLSQRAPTAHRHDRRLSLIHISEPTRQAEISYAVFCLK